MSRSLLLVLFNNSLINEAPLLRQSLPFGCFRQAYNSCGIFMSLHNFDICHCYRTGPRQRSQVITDNKVNVAPPLLRKLWAMSYLLLYHIGKHLRLVFQSCESRCCRHFITHVLKKTLIAGYFLQLVSCFFMGTHLAIWLVKCRTAAVAPS